MEDLPIEFVLQQISDRGTSTPCVARTVPQAGELIGVFDVTDEQREEVLGSATRVMEHLIACLEIIERVREQIEEGREMLKERGLQKQAGGQVVQLPRVVNLQKEAENFLYNAKLALRDTGALLGVFHDVSFSPHRYDRALEWARTQLGVDSAITELIEQDLNWIERAIGMRNAVEHPEGSRGALQTRGFAVECHRSETVVVEPMWWTNEHSPEFILQEMEVLHHNLLTFFEELLVLILLDSLPEGSPITIYEIAEEDRDPDNPVRFRVGLKGPLPGISEASDRE